MIANIFTEINPFYNQAKNSGRHVCGNVSLVLIAKKTTLPLKTFRGLMTNNMKWIRKAKTINQVTEKTDIGNPMIITVLARCDKSRRS